MKSGGTDVNTVDDIVNVLRDARETGNLAGFQYLTRDVVVENSEALLPHLFEVCEPKSSSLNLLNAGWKCLQSLVSAIAPGKRRPVALCVAKEAIVFMMDRMKEVVCTADWEDARQAKLAAFCASHIVAAARAQPQLAFRCIGVEAVHFYHAMCVTCATCESSAAAGQLHRQIIVRMLGVIDIFGSSESLRRADGDADAVGEGTGPLSLPERLLLMRLCVANMPSELNEFSASGCAHPALSLSALQAMCTAAAATPFPPTIGPELLRCMLLWLPSMAETLFHHDTPIQLQLSERSTAATKPSHEGDGKECDPISIVRSICREVARLSATVPLCSFVQVANTDESVGHRWWLATASVLLSHIDWQIAQVAENEGGTSVGEATCSSPVAAFFVALVVRQGTCSSSHGQMIHSAISPLIGVDKSRSDVLGLLLAALAVTSSTSLERVMALWVTLFHHLVTEFPPSQSAEARPSLSRITFLEVLLSGLADTGSMLYTAECDGYRVSPSEGVAVDLTALAYRVALLVCEGCRILSTARGALPLLPSGLMAARPAQQQGRLQKPDFATFCDGLYWLHSCTLASCDAATQSLARLSLAAVGEKENMEAQLRKCEPAATQPAADSLLERVTNHVIEAERLLLGAAKPERRESTCCSAGSRTLIGAVHTAIAVCTEEEPASCHSQFLMFCSKLLHRMTSQSAAPSACDDQGDREVRCTCQQVACSLLAWAGVIGDGSPPFMAALRVLIRTAFDEVATCGSGERMLLAARSLKLFTQSYVNAPLEQLHFGEDVISLLVHLLKPTCGPSCEDSFAAVSDDPPVPGSNPPDASSAAVSIAESQTLLDLCTTMDAMEFRRRRQCRQPGKHGHHDYNVGILRSAILECIPGEKLALQGCYEDNETDAVDSRSDGRSLEVPEEELFRECERLLSRIAELSLTTDGGTGQALGSSERAMRIARLKQMLSEISFCDEAA